MNPPSPTPEGRVRAMAAAAGLSPWLAVVALGFWTARPAGAALALSALGVVGATFALAPLHRARAAALAVVVLAILAGFEGHRQTVRIHNDWAGYWTERQEVVGELLSRRLQEKREAGERAADSLAALASGSATPVVDVSALEELKATTGVSAIALYDREGRLTVWAGTHRGRVPEEVRRGLRRYVYRDLPLFGYLYVSAVIPNGWIAVAATLLRTDLPPELGADLGDFASDFRAAVGEEIRVVADAPPGSEAVWDLELPNRRLLSVVLAPPDPGARAASAMLRWRTVVAVLSLAAWLLLAVGGPTSLRSGISAAASLFLLAGTLPFGAHAALAPYFDATRFALPGPVPVSLGRLGLLVLAGVTLISVMPRPRVRLHPWAAGLTVALAFPVLLAWLEAGLFPETLGEGRATFVVYEAVAAILMTLVAGTCLMLAGESTGARARPELRWLSGAAVAAGLVLGAVGAGFVWMRGSGPVWWPLLWGLPVALAAVAMEHWTGWRKPLVAWVVGAVLAGSAAVPAAWGERVSAGFEIAERRLGRLASPGDPQLERGLERLALAADSAVVAGEDGVDLLYGAWRASGLRDGRHPLRLTLWSAAGVPEQELRVGVALARPTTLTDVLAAERAPDAVRIFEYERSDARYILRADMPDGRILTTVAPPYSETLDRSPLAPLMGLSSAEEPDPLTLIPSSQEPPGDTRGPVWRRVGRGFQAELPVTFENAAYHVHYVVELPDPMLGLARGTLLVALNLGLFALFWLGGRRLLGRAFPTEARLSSLVISFRARVTLALFGFFVLANTLFGTLALRSLGSASTRAAQVLAERLAEDAAEHYLDVSGRMEPLAQQVGAELLEYRDGALHAGSVEELVELGVYEGWLPYEVARLLDGREGVSALVESSLGRWRYETAFRRLPDGDILATQVPLQAGATAIRTADLVELMAFALLLGALLSFALALTVGRALTRPIHALQVASERVGGGNLDLRLPERRADEFGAVFEAFNRMVGRVRRARRQLLRTSRRTQTIMDEAAVGMLALDAAGRVTLVNPRAESLLEAPVEVGERVPARGPVGKSLAWWLAQYIDRDAAERTGEITAGDRRFRVRARTLGSEEAMGGVVVAFEDVTDELRTERVLAWGEMARQVAHEVKNPLTPIKLSIQHIRRAWQDRRPDFEEILLKNADAMLMEIDRLAGIAEGFSRFGAPSDARGEPLSAVDVATVVDEVLTLYGGGEGPIRFERSVADGLPPAATRAHELKEVLVNLLENARAAVDDEGVVRIALERGPMGGVSVAVSDTGSGIPPDLMARIFEPHFSTRSKGTGLGLAIVRRLVESWDGSVTVDSTPGEGTTVVVTLAAWRP